MKRAFPIALILLCIAAAAFPDTIVEILTSEYQPYSGTSGPSIGCDLINAAFAREGVAVEWKFLPQSLQTVLVARGTSVAMAQSPLAIAPEERPSFIFNENPYIYISVVAFYPKAKYPRGLGLKSPADLKGKIVGVIRGTGSVEVLQNAGAALDVSDDKDQLMRKLVVGRCDIAVVSDLTGLYSLQSLNEADEYGYEPLYRSPLDLIFSAKHPGSADLRKKYNSGLAKIKADGTYMRILARFYPNGKVNRDALSPDMR